MDICTVDSTAITVDTTAETADAVCVVQAEQLYARGRAIGGNSGGVPDDLWELASPGAEVQHLRVRPIGGGGDDGNQGILDVYPRTFAGYTTSAQNIEVIAPLTAVAFDSVLGFWVRWEEGGVNGRDIIKGFTYPDPVFLEPLEEVLGQVLLQGAIHYDDIANQKTPAFIAALRAMTRPEGLWIESLPAVR